MKWIKPINLFESVQSYQFDKGDDLHYYFIDEFRNEFMVEFDKIGDNEVECVYLVKDNTKQHFKWTYKEVKTNIFKVTQTILSDIIIDFMKNNPNIEEILIKGLSKEKEKDFISQRTKWYLRFLERNPIEGWSVERSGNEIYLFKN